MPRKSSTKKPGATSVSKSPSNLTGAKKPVTSKDYNVSARDVMHLKFVESEEDLRVWFPLVAIIYIIVKTAKKK